MCWIWLFLAIFLEVAATVLMKLSNGLTRSVPTLGMFVLYGLSFIPMTIALKEMEIGAVYAIWSAVGTAAVAVLGVIVFHEQASALKAIAIVLIIAGVVCLNLATRHSSPNAGSRQAQLRNELRLDINPKSGHIAATSAASSDARLATAP
jgi:small multidrug resistance pump